MFPFDTGGHWKITWQVGRKDAMALHDQTRRPKMLQNMISRGAQSALKPSSSESSDRCLRSDDRVGDNLPKVQRRYFKPVSSSQKPYARLHISEPALLIVT